MRSLTNIETLKRSFSMPTIQLAFYCRPSLGRSGTLIEILYLDFEISKSIIFFKILYFHSKSNYTDKTICILDNLRLEK